MTIRLVILGLLSQKQLHGYEIKHIIENHMGDWTDIKFGSIYFALSKLAEAGDIEVVEENQTGKRPAKTVYQITSKGKNEFMTLLRKQWREHKQVFYPIDIAVFFMLNLNKEEVAKSLATQSEILTEKLSYLKNHTDELQKNPRVPRLATAILEHSKCHLEAELQWVQKLREDLDLYY
jgi:DNA-binding PadR family transcriptional regulator